MGYSNTFIEEIVKDNENQGRRIAELIKHNEKLCKEIEFLRDCIGNNHTNFRNIFYRAFEAERQLMDAQNEIKELKEQLKNKDIK